MDDAATEPTDRRRLLVRRLMSHRGQSDTVTVRADERRLHYGDRLLELSVDASERDRLDDLLGDYPVFKLKQPATRKADGDTVYVAAVADPKHLADFIEDCCRRVYELPETYPLRLE
jgi:hypothetical protein